MKIKINKINDSDTNVSVNSAEGKIEAIKNKLSSSKPLPCKVPVMDMWDDDESEWG